MAIEQFIDNEVKSNDVVLFMKGTPHSRCAAFPARSCRSSTILASRTKASTCWKTRSCATASRAILNWPTIPQLYVKGEFVGGCDIIREMFQAGELQR